MPSFKMPNHGKLTDKQKKIAQKVFGGMPKPFDQLRKRKNPTHITVTGVFDAAEKPKLHTPKLFKKWIEQQNCIRCDRADVTAHAIYADRTAFDIGIAPFVLVDYWALLPLCVHCKQPENDLLTAIADWLVLTCKYSGEVNGKVPAFIKLAMIKSMTGTLGYDVEFKPLSK